MMTLDGKTLTLSMEVNELYQLFSSPAALEKYLQSVGNATSLEKYQLTEEGLTFNISSLDYDMKIIKKETLPPSLIVYEAEDSPIVVRAEINLAPNKEEISKSDFRLKVELGIPEIATAFIRPTMDAFYNQILTAIETNFNQK